MPKATQNTPNTPNKSEPNKSTPNNIVPIKTETKPKRTSKHSAANLPQSRAGLIQTEEDRQFVAKLLTEVLVEYNRPRVKNDEELAERLSSYFDMCARTGQVPTVEEMLLGTGYGHHYMNDIEAGRRKGFSPETATILKKAKAYMATFDAKLAVSGKMNFLAYCFRAKNYYGMVDKQEHVITPTVNDDLPLNESELLKRYAAEDSQTIETTAEDV